MFGWFFGTRCVTGTRPTTRRVPHPTRRFPLRPPDYATSKQSSLAAAMEFSRETSRLRFNALEPGFTPNAGLARDTNAFLRFQAN